MRKSQVDYRKFLCVDHGGKRIGIAVSNETAFIARPHSIIKHISREEDATRVLEIAIIENCTDILVGVPYDSDGGIGVAARRVLRFVELLKSISPVPVHLWDETGSSLALEVHSIRKGESSKQRRKPSDDRVAALILQDYLDHQAIQRDNDATVQS